MAAAVPMPRYPTVPLLLTLAFCGYITLWYLQVSARIPVLGAVRFELFFPLMLAVWALMLGPSLASPLTGFVIALLLCIVIQVPLSVDTTLSWNVFLDRVAKFLAIAFLIVSIVRGPRELKLFLGAFVLAALKLGQEGLFGVVSGSLLWENQGVLRLHGPTPMYLHPNSFAGFALGALPFAIYLFPVANRWQKAALMALGVCIGTIVVFSGSRTGYVGAAGLLVVVLLRSAHKVRALAVAVAVTAIVAAAIPQGYVERFESIYTQEDKEGASTELRKEILTDAWNIFLDYPLGVGVGAFPVVRHAVFGRDQDTHNLYLEVGTNLGVQGLVAFVAFITAVLLLLSRIAHRVSSQTATLLKSFPSARPNGLAEHLGDLRLLKQTAMAVQAFVIVRLFLGLFGMDLYEIYWWFALGLAIALYQMQAIAERRTSVWLGDTTRNATPMHVRAPR